MKYGCKTCGECSLMVQREQEHTADRVIVKGRCIRKRWGKVFIRVEGSFPGCDWSEQAIMAIWDEEPV